MKRQTLILLLMILMCVIFVAGCGSSGEQTGGTDTTTDTNQQNVPDEEKVVNLISWGGTIQQTFEAEGWADKFYQETGYKLVLTPKSTSSEIVAAATAQKDDPQFDVLMCDVGPFLNGAAQGLFTPLASVDLANKADMLPDSISDYGIQPYTSCGVIIYNPTYFKQQGWAAPTSWADLLDSKYAGKIVLNPPDMTFGLFALVELAKLGGGGESNIEPGLEALKQIAPGVVDWPTTYSQIGEYFQGGSAVIAATEYVAAMDMKRKGMDIEVVIPEEGTLASPVMAGVIKDCKHPNGAALFLNFLIGKEFLEYQATTFGKGAYNTSVQLTGDAAEYSLTKDIDKLTNLDWVTVNANRDSWVERFNKEVAPLTGTAK